MAFFTAIGVISNDIVRRETKNGVVTTFRLETGAPRGRKLWIDVECWGHLAGTIAHHGETGREVSVSGRLIAREWREQATGHRRRRHLVRALDVDLFSPAHVSSRSVNQLVLRGEVTTGPQLRNTDTGQIGNFDVRVRGRKNDGHITINARLWLPKGRRFPVSGAGPQAFSGALAHERQQSQPVLVVRTADWDSQLSGDQLPAETGKKP